MKIKSLIASAAFVASSLAMAPSAHAAGSASLGLSASGSRTVGSTFSVTVVENSGATTVNGAEADLSYNASQLQFLGKSCGGAFEVAAPSSGANLACATVTPKAGGQAVGTVSFRVLTAGTASIGFASSSQITAADGSGTNVWNGSAAGGSYGFVTPAPVVSTPVAAAPAAAAPVKKPVQKAKTEKLSYTTPSKTTSHLSAWIYVPIGLIAAAAGVAYVFRSQSAKLSKKTQKGLRSFTKKFAIW